MNSQIHFFKVSKTESSKTLDLWVRESLHSTSGQRDQKIELTQNIFLIARLIEL